MGKSGKSWSFCTPADKHVIFQGVVCIVSYFKTGKIKIWWILMPFLYSAYLSACQCAAGSRLSELSVQMTALLWTASLYALDKSVKVQVCVSLWACGDWWFFMVSNLYPGVLNSLWKWVIRHDFAEFCPINNYCIYTSWSKFYVTFLIPIFLFHQVDSEYFTEPLSFSLLGLTVFFPWSCPSASYNTGTVWSGWLKPPLKKSDIYSRTTKIVPFFIKITPPKKLSERCFNRVVKSGPN